MSKWHIWGRRILISYSVPLLTCSVLTLWPLNSSIGSLHNVHSVNTSGGALCSCISFRGVRLHSKHRSGLVHHGFPSWGSPIGYGPAPCVFILGPRLRGQPLSGTHKGKRAPGLMEPHDGSKNFRSNFAWLICPHFIAEASLCSNLTAEQGRMFLQGRALHSPCLQMGCLILSQGGANGWWWRQPDSSVCDHVG